MIIHECRQGTLEWHQARLGIPTASGASNIVTNTGRLSSSRDKYMHLLVAEWWRGEPESDYQSAAMLRGTELESKAREHYDFLYGDAVNVQQVGLIYRDESRLASCSPDWIEVSEDGEIVAGVEAKCPLLSTHIGYALSAKEGYMPTDYRMQVQFSLWVTGLPCWRFFSYAEDVPSALVTIHPDPDIQGALDEHMPTFISDLIAAREAFRQFVMGESLAS